MQFLQSIMEPSLFLTEILKFFLLILTFSNTNTYHFSRASKHKMESIFSLFMGNPSVYEKNKIAMLERRLLEQAKLHHEISHEKDKEICRLNKKIEILGHELDKKNDTIIRNEKERSTLATQLDGQKATTHKLANRINKLEYELEQKNDRMESANREKTHQIRILQHTIDMYQYQLEETEEMLDRKEDELEKVTALLRDKKRLFKELAEVFDEKAERLEQLQSGVDLPKKVPALNNNSP